MISILICSLFIASALYAFGAIGFTHQCHAGAWRELASERARLRARVDARSVSDALPKLVSTRLPAQAGGYLPSQRRFSQRTAFPFQPARRAAA